MSSSSVNDLKIGEHDLNQRLVVDIYSRQADRYAVYQTVERVVITYADDPLIQRLQRKRLAGLAVLRSEIDGMLAPWRAKAQRWSRLAITARQYDMRVYPALVEALEGRADIGQAILQQVKTDITGDMGSRARLAYVIWSIAAAVVLLAICVSIDAAIGSVYASDFLVPPAERRLLLAGMCTGILGALYSIAMRIRQRELESDLRRLDYITDSFVRLGLGAIGAFIFGCFLVSGAVEINFGQRIAPGQGGTAGPNFIYLVLIAGFLAGFVERLVPDLLNSYAISGRKQDTAAPPASLALPGVVTHALATSPPAETVAKDEEDAITTAPSDEESIDGCDVHLDEPGLATPDEELPASSGGVAKP